MSVNSTLADLCGTVSNGTSFAYNGYSLPLSPYMTVGGATYYGVACGVTDILDEGDDDASGMPKATLIAIILSASAILLFIAALVIWKCKSNEKNSNSGNI